MKTTFLLTITLLFYCCSSYSQNVQTFTTRQKLKDFTYMYHILEENYPYFGVNKRIHHTDWLANKKVYENKIRNTKSDKEFYKTMAGILGDLHNGHTDFLPTLYYSYFLKTYSAATGRNAKYRHWVNELKKKSVKKHRTYWREIVLTPYKLD